MSIVTCYLRSLSGGIRKRLMITVPDGSDSCAVNLRLDL